MAIEFTAFSLNLSHNTELSSALALHQGGLVIAVHPFFNEKVTRTRAKTGDEAANLYLAKRRALLEQLRRTKAPAIVMEERTTPLDELRLNLKDNGFDGTIWYVATDVDTPTPILRRFLTHDKTWLQYTEMMKAVGVTVVTLAGCNYAEVQTNNRPMHNSRIRRLDKWYINMVSKNQSPPKTIPTECVGVTAKQLVVANIPVTISEAVYDTRRPMW